MGMTIRRPATAISDARAGEGTRDLASVVSWYTFIVENLGATSEEARGLMESVISAIELNPPRAAKFPELFVYLDAQWRHFGQKRKLLDEWLAKMARDPLYWPPRPRPRGSRVGHQILKALRTGRKTDVQIVRAFPKSAKMTLTKLRPTLGLAMKAGKIMRVGWGEYALPESGLAAYISPNRLLVELVIGAPDYPPAQDALVAAMRVRGHTDDGTYHSLKWLRQTGVLAPPRDGRVRLSAESLAKRERGEEIRDGRGTVLWAPPLVVPAELQTWENRLIDASRGGTPDLGDTVTLRSDRPRVDLAKRAAEVSRLAALTDKEYAAERDIVAKAWGLDDIGMLDLMVVPARKHGNAVPPAADVMMRSKSPPIGLAANPRQAEVASPWIAPTVPVQSKTQMKKAAREECERLLKQRYDEYVGNLDPNKERPLKDEIRSDMLRIPNLTVNAFDETWQKLGLEEWKAPGAPTLKKTPEKTPEKTSEKTPEKKSV
jgi:hypothetical protein